MRFELTKDFLGLIRVKIAEGDELWLTENVLELHYADVAEILDKLTNDQAKFIYFLVDEDTQADILMELEEEVRDRFIASLSTKEIADQLENLDSDDAADILGELSSRQIQEVISQMEDDEAAEDIVDLLNYDEDTAGGLMGKELVKVNENWNVLTCVKEMRLQAENISRVHSIYVIDDEERLKGRLSLKDLLTTSTKTPISQVYIKKVNYVKVDAMYVKAFLEIQN